jgi:hypothetical protein
MTSYGIINPLYPPIMGEIKGDRGTPPNPRQEISPAPHFTSVPEGGFETRHYKNIDIT